MKRAVPLRAIEDTVCVRACCWMRATSGVITLRDRAESNERSTRPSVSDSSNPSRRHNIDYTGVNSVLSLFAPVFAALGRRIIRYSRIANRECRMEPWR